MAKFNVGVGDAFPVETGETRGRDDEPRHDQGRRDGDRPDHKREDGCESGRKRPSHRYWYVKVPLILLVIFGVLSLFYDHAPRGLLVAAAIVFGVGVVISMLGDGRRSGRFWFVDVSLILLAIYGGLWLFNDHAPRGLLMAAAMVFGIGLVLSLFGDGRRRRRREDRRESRRTWRDR